jgi:hypothetical protein
MSAWSKKKKNGIEKGRREGGVVSNCKKVGGDKGERVNGKRGRNTSKVIINY